MAIFDIVFSLRTMIGRLSLLIVLTGTCLVYGAVAQQRDPLLKFEADQLPPPPQSLNLYDALQVGTTSPRGESSVGLDDSQMEERARDFMAGTAARPRDDDEAQFWLRQLVVSPLRSTDSYSRWALETLANMWLPSDSGKRDPVTMHKLRLVWELLALSNNARALCNLGFIYQDGIGVPRDLQAARAWLEMADAAGCPEARTALTKLN